MKIRSGFVSNSSSCSFLLLYDSSNVLNSPEEILDFINKHPKEEILMRSPLGEGDDFITLSDKYKSLIRRFAKEFIKYNQPYKDYWGDEKRITAYINAFGIDQCLESAWTFNDTEEDYRKKVDVIKENRIKEQERLSKDSAACEEVYVDYNSLDTDESTYDFVDRYLVRDSIDDYNDFTRRSFKKTQPRAFIIGFNEDITDKKEIMEVLKDNTKKCFMSWFCGPANLFDYEDKNTYEFFEVGDEERRAILDNKDAFMECFRTIHLYTDFDICFNTLSDKVKNSKETSLGYSRILVHDENTCVPDFSNIMLGKEFIDINGLVRDFDNNDYDEDEDY